MRKDLALAVRFGPCGATSWRSFPPSASSFLRRRTMGRAMRCMGMRLRRRGVGRRVVPTMRAEG